MPVLVAIFLVGIVATIALAILGSHGWGALCKFSAEASGREWYYYNSDEATKQVFPSLVILGAFATIAAILIALHLGVSVETML